jgi:AcrR family transcriptional regulator
VATTSRKLSTADERRETVLRAAGEVFAERGIHGTPTTAVAAAAGISHAYLFRLFPTKNDLAVALVRRTHDRIRATFADAASAARTAGTDVLEAMGVAYVDLLQDRQLLLLQLHSHAAAASVPAIREATRSGFQDLVELVQRESGAPAEDVQRFFANGMLINILAPWTRRRSTSRGRACSWARTAEPSRPSHFPRR